MRKPRSNYKIKKKILIVEDSADFSALLRQLLHGEGYEVETAANGQEALNSLKNNPDLPDLILLDLMMPIMDGLEFRKRQEMDERWGRIPVVVMTAHQDAQITRLKIGARDFLRKPPEIDEILAVVKRNLSN